VLICSVWIVQGRHLKRGSRLVDFHIKLGDSAVCVPVSLTDNHVQCRPPTNTPNGNIKDVFCDDHTVYLQVGQVISLVYHER